MNKDFFSTSAANLLGIVCILVGLFFSIPALWKFLKTKNTLVTAMPASSLQTTGIYSISRNPMYMSLLLVYAGLSFMIGNWWNLFLLPVLFLVVQEYIIRREEKYLERQFGQTYLDYKLKVRRWV